jgi:pyridoxal phosphate enzyme (YggS family)
MNSPPPARRETEVVAAELSGIAQRLATVREVVEEARTSARRRDTVMVVAVGKTVPPAVVGAAYAAGQRVFGENRVQEAIAKMDQLAEHIPEAQWHMIGHLQSNKARQAGERFDLVESVDSTKLATLLDGAAAGAARQLPVLLEVNVGGEMTKHGFHPDALAGILPALLELGHIEVRGLMTVAPPAPDPEDVRWVFRHLRELRDELRDRYQLERLRELSMGMSSDFRVAIEEGATMVRIGRAIFGERPVVRGQKESS